MTEYDSTTAPIVVGVDGSAPSREALRWALQLATTAGAPIEAVAAWHLPPIGYGMAGGPVYQPEADTKAMLDVLVDEVAGAADVLRTVTEGGAARVLIDASRHARLLVVGSAGTVGSPVCCSGRSAPRARSTPSAPSWSRTAPWSG